MNSPVGSILIIKPLLEPKRHGPAPESPRNRMMLIGSIFQVTFQGEVINIIFTFKGRTGKLEFRFIEIPGTGSSQGAVELVGNDSSPLSAEGLIAIVQINGSILDRKSTRLNSSHVA